MGSTHRQTVSISLTKTTNVRTSQLENYRFICIASRGEGQHVFFCNGIMLYHKWRMALGLTVFQLLACHSYWRDKSCTKIKSYFFLFCHTDEEILGKVFLLLSKACFPFAWLFSMYILFKSIKVHQLQKTGHCSHTKYCSEKKSPKG